MIDSLFRRLIRSLLKFYYRKFGFLAWSFSYNETTEIHVLTEEFINEYHRYGTRYEFLDEENKEWEKE